MKALAAAALVAASVLATTACAGASGRVYIRSGPPPVRAEAVLVSPGPGYVWVAGRYERAPRARARWVPSHWERDRRGWYFVEGRWR